jgi:two-component system NtrC family sensor kinase
VRGLLDFARQRKPDKREWDIHVLISNTLTLVEEQAPFQNIKIDKQFKTGIPMLFVDGDQIQQVFMNILLNASDAMAKKGGTLTIKTESRDGNAEVSFTDTGLAFRKSIFKNSLIPSLQPNSREEV